jgi:hypothetical protein
MSSETSVLDVSEFAKFEKPWPFCSEMRRDLVINIRPTLSGDVLSFLKENLVKDCASLVQ